MGSSASVSGSDKAISNARRPREIRAERKSENVSSPHPPWMRYAAAHNGQWYARRIVASNMLRNSTASSFESWAICAVSSSHFLAMLPCEASCACCTICQKFCSSIIRTQGTEVGRPATAEYNFITTMWRAVQTLSAWNSAFRPPSALVGLDHVGEGRQLGMAGRSSLLHG